VEFSPDDQTGYTDGSRIQDYKAAAGYRSSQGLGTYAMVVDAELLSLAIGLEEVYRTLASDSQGGITRILNLKRYKPSSWIEQRCQAAGKGADVTLIWVKGHNGVKGNEEANYRAKLEALNGSLLQKPNLATPASIKQAHPLYQHSSPVKSWDRQALKGLTYIVTDRGPFRHWLHHIGKAGDGKCKCGVTQNSAHITECGEVGDGKRRKIEEIWTDQAWCAEVYQFLSE